MVARDVSGPAWSSGPVVLGCGTFGGIGGVTDLIGKGLGEEAAFATLDEAVGLGIVMLDTAERYAAGRSEEIIGRWLADRDASQDVEITTKVAPAEVSGRDERFDLAFMEPIVRGSLGRLGVDHVDWLLTHAPDDATPIEATLEALESLSSSGYCRHVGGCNLGIDQLREALDAAERLGIRGYELVQNGYSVLQPDDGADVRRICRERGLAFTAFSPLAGGVLTGKYRRGDPPTAGSRLDLRPEGFDELLTPASHDAIESLAARAGELGASAGSLALAWLMHRDDVTALITGPSRTAPHLGLAADALDLALDDITVDELADRFRASSTS